MITDKLSENRSCTKAMVSVERRFSETKMRTATITHVEFRAISDYIEALEHETRMLAAENHSLLSQEIQPEDYQIDSREVLVKHLDSCPECGGVVDNGYIRGWIEPTPYIRTKCQEDG